MKDRPAANPPIRFRDVTIAYEAGDGPPPAQVTLLEDHARTILSHNEGMAKLRAGGQGRDQVD